MSPSRPIQVFETKYTQQDKVVEVPANAPGLAHLRCRVRYIDTGGSGTPVLYLHGHGSRLEEGEAVYDALKDLGVRAIGFDLPPFGYSEKISAPTGTYSVAMLRWITRALMESLGIKGALVAGGSLGGNLALRLAQAHPSWVSKVVIWSPACAWAPQQGLQTALGSWLSPALSQTGWAGFEASINLIKEKWYSQGHFKSQDPTTDVEWSPAERQAELDCVIAERREVWSPEYHKAYWEIAMEQLKDSLFGIAHDITPKALLLAAVFDDGAPEHLYQGTKKLAALMAKAHPATRLREIRTGHSVHNEAPVKLASIIHEWLTTG